MILQCLDNKVILEEGEEGAGVEWRREGKGREESTILVGQAQYLLHFSTFLRSLKIIYIDC